MNSSITTDDYFSCHTFTNVEFTGVFERIKIRSANNGVGSALYCIHVFIKYGDKVYIEDHLIGHIVISFDELLNNKYWKHYYDLSLLLTNNKHHVIEDIKYNSNFSYGPLYGGYNVYHYQSRLWWIDTATIDSSVERYEVGQEITRTIENCGHLCYYKINPYDLENMEYTSHEDINIFNQNCMSRICLFRFGQFEKNSVIRNELVISYIISLIEKELEELSVIFEDKKNVINLIPIYDMKIINQDIIMMIYNNIVSAEGNRRYKSIMTELGAHNQLERTARILSA